MWFISAGMQLSWSELERLSQPVRGGSADLKTSPGGLLLHVTGSQAGRMCAPFTRARRGLRVASSFPSQNHGSRRTLHCPGRRVERGQEHSASGSPSTRSGAHISHYPLLQH